MNVNSKQTLGEKEQNENWKNLKKIVLKANYYMEKKNVINQRKIKWKIPPFLNRTQKNFFLFFALSTFDSPTQISQSITKFVLYVEMSFIIYNAKRYKIDKKSAWVVLFQYKRSITLYKITYRSITCPKVFHFLYFIDWFWIFFRFLVKCVGIFFDFS